MISGQVYVVMGGWDAASERLASTEKLVLGEKKWSEIKALPVPLTELRATTLDNIVYITGQMSHCYSYSYYKLLFLSFQ